MRLGIFGGTFDPPHLGHLILAGEALDQLHLDRVLWVLTPEPPHKLQRYFAPLPARLDMMVAAIDAESNFELNRVDIERPGPHYALDTMHLLAEQHPHDQMVYLIGGDSLSDLPTWHRPHEFIKTCQSIGVMRRPGFSVNLDAIEQAIPGIGAKIQFVEAPLIEISSSEIRRRVRAGRTYKYFVRARVYDLINQRRLYRD
jgi:nicotinate-nucleotide adenylyltransferase